MARLGTREVLVARLGTDLVEDEDVAEREAERGERAQRGCAAHEPRGRHPRARERPLLGEPDHALHAARAARAHVLVRSPRPILCAQSCVRSPRPLFCAQSCVRSARVLVCPRRNTSARSCWGGRGALRPLTTSLLSSLSFHTCPPRTSSAAADKAGREQSRPRTSTPPLGAHLGRGVTRVHPVERERVARAVWEAALARGRNCPERKLRALAVQRALREKINEDADNAENEWYADSSWKWATRGEPRARWQQARTPRGGARNRAGRACLRLHHVARGALVADVRVRFDEPRDLSPSGSRGHRTGETTLNGRVEGGGRSREPGTSG